MNYTKGDWKVEAPQNKGIKARIISNERAVIATVNNADDANVMAASKEMYEALRAVESSVICNGDMSFTYAIDGRIKKQISQALQKAEGKVK